MAWKQSVPAARHCALLRNEQARFFFFFLLLLERARSERCRGFSAALWECLARPDRDPTERGILLPVTMNRKPSPPPEPTQTFDVKGGSHSRCGSTAHSCLGCLATSPHHASQLRSDGTRTDDLRRQQTETTEAPAHVVQCLEDTFEIEAPTNGQDGSILARPLWKVDPQCCGQMSRTWTSVSEVMWVPQQLRRVP